MYRLVCILSCRTYDPTYALADTNNNVTIIEGKGQLYNVAQNYGISNAKISVDKKGNIKIEDFPVSYFTKTYRIATAWTDCYNCQSGELGAILAREYAYKLLKSGEVYNRTVQ